MREDLLLIIRSVVESLPAPDLSSAAALPEPDVPAFEATLLEASFELDGPLAEPDVAVDAPDAL